MADQPRWTIDADARLAERKLKDAARFAAYRRLGTIANTTVATVDITSIRECDHGDGRRATCCVLVPRDPIAKYLCVDCADRTAQGWASASPDEFTTITVAW